MSGLVWAFIPGFEGLYYANQWGDFAGMIIADWKTDMLFAEWEKK
jgi:hypothetical protein